MVVVLWTQNVTRPKLLWNRRTLFVTAVSRFGPTKLTHFCAPAWVTGGGGVGSFVLTVFRVSRYLEAFFTTHSAGPAGPLGCSYTWRSIGLEGWAWYGWAASGERYFAFL
jgi:hypothetical protein